MNNKKLENLLRDSLEVKAREGFKEDLKAKLVGETKKSGLFGRLVYSMSFAMIAVVAVGAVYFYKPQEGLFEKVYAENMAFYDEVEQKLASGYILYEKVLHESAAGNGVEQHSSILETWSDGKGNSLSIPRDAVTEEILGGEYGGPSMVLTNGDKNMFYTTDSKGFGLEAYSPKDPYQCLEKGISNDSGRSFTATLDVDEDDIAKGDLGGFGLGYYYDQKDPEVEADINDRNLLFSLRSPIADNNKFQAFEELKNKKDVTYKEVIEGGKTYYVFTAERKLMMRGASAVDNYYIDGENYRLMKVDSQYFNKDKNPANRSTITFLGVDYIPGEQSKEIFDPEKYDLYLQPVTVSKSIPVHTEEGCYYPDGIKMTDAENEEFWATVPEGTKQSFKEYIEEIKSFN